MDLIKYDMTDIWASAGDVVAPDSAKINAGWGVEVVPRQWWNWFENRQDQNIAYMLQKGFPEWDSTTEYIINKSYVQRNGVVYKATATSTNSDPVALTSWVRAFPNYTVALDALGALTPSVDQLPYFNGTSTAATTPFSAFARTLVDDANAAAARTTLAAQADHVNLTALSGVTAVTNGLPYFTGTTAMGITTLTAFGRSLIDDADAATARVTLGLGTSATRDIVVSTTDNTPGRVLIPGSGYLLANTPLETDGGTASTVWYGNRFKGWDGSNAGAYAPTNGAAVGLEMGYGANRRMHLAITTGNQLFYRYTADPADTSAWKTVWDTGNLVKTANTTDLTTGRILQTGDFGLGRSLSIAAGADLNVTLAPASYAFTSGTPLVNTPWGAAQYVDVKGRSEYPHQEVSAIYQNRWWRRTANKAFPTSSAADWTSWVELYHTGNLIKTTTSTDTTAGSILKVGDFGLGASLSDVPTIPSFTQHNPSGLYRSVTAAWPSAPAGAPANPSGTAQGLQVFVTGYPSNTFYFAVDASGVMYSSIYNGTTLSAWKTISPGDQGTPSGTIISFAGSSVPTGYLLANGSAVSRTTYAELFAAIGTTYGAGDGSTTFNLPELRGEFLRGLDNGRGVDASRTLGSAQAYQLTSHTHTFTGTAYAGHTHTGTTTADAHTHTWSGTTSSSGDHTHALEGRADQSASGTRPQPATGSVVGNMTGAIGTAGAHTHTVSGTTSSDSHSHTFTTATGGAFTPAGTNSAFGGTTNSSETRPRNVAVQFLIKY